MQKVVEKENGQLQSNTTAPQKKPKSIVFRSTIKPSDKNDKQIDPPFEIRPTEIVFHNVKENTVYEINFAVRNKTNTKRKIKMTHPTQSVFEIQHDDLEFVAPGLSIKAKMLYTCKTNQEVHSSFIVYTEDYKLEVPVAAFPPCPFFVFEPILDFGFISLDETIKRDIKIRNEGLRSGEMVFNSRDPSVLRIEPKELEIEAEQERYVTLIMTPNRMGAWNGLIDIEMTGHAIYKAIDCTATVVSHNVYIMNDKGEELQSLDFNVNLCGKVSKRKVQIVNSSPNVINFNINIIRGFHASSNEKTQLQTPLDMGREMTEKVLTVNPSVGKIEPYGKIDISFLFNNITQDIDKAISQKITKAGKFIVIEERAYKYTAWVEFDKKIENKYLLISAMTIPPQITFDKTEIEFDDVKMGETKTHLITIKNWNDKLKVEVNCPNEFYLHSDPKSIVINSLEEKQLKLIFTPKHMGVINKVVNFMINDQFELPIKIFGVGVQSSTSNPNLKSKIELIKTKNFHTENPQKLKLPSISTQNYNTHNSDNNNARKFVPDPHTLFKEFDSKPSNIDQSRFCTLKLSPDQFMKINVGPVELNFGKVFVKSTSALYFQVRNDLQNPIKVQLDIGDLFELRDSYTKPQIIPGGKTAGFKVAINCASTRIFKEKINYIINGHHIFGLMVMAEVVPVSLELSKSIVNFKFNEESLDMTSSETVTLINKGNAEAKFVVKTREGSPFTVDIPDGIVGVSRKLDLKITYTPSSIKDEDVITIDIDHGVEKTITCCGLANETTCELNPTNVNMGVIAIGQTKTASFTLKNLNNKYYSIFKIDKNTLPPFLILKPLTGKICPEDFQKFEMEFYSKKPVEFKNHDIDILIRGSRKIKLSLSVSTILPVINIEEPVFDFQTITFGSKAMLPMTIVNESAISAELILHLFSSTPSLQEKYDCLEIESECKNDSILFEQVGEAYFSQLNDKKSQITVDRDSSHRSFVFYLKPNTSYKYLLSFSPIKPDSYEFELPFYLPGQDKLPVIVRTIKCIGSNPKFLMEPLNGQIEFKRKIIISPESVIPEYKSLTISNPNFDEPLVWRLDTNILNSQKVFTIIPDNGMIDPQCTVSLKIGFKPHRAQNFDHSVPLYLAKETIPYTEIKLKGEGAVPKLLFDSEEIILPIVPLGVRSTIIMHVYNDGYQNSNINAILPQEYASLPLAVKFLNGSTIGINNNKLKLELSFISSTPISFTTRMDFEDDQKRIFSVYISGTTDNSLLTNYLYFIENPRYRYDFDNNKGPIALIEENQILDQSMSQSNVFSYHSADQEDSVQREINQLLDIALTVKGWLREYGIASIEKFPDDVIEVGGLQIYDLVDFLVKNTLQRPDVNSASKKTDKAKEQMDCYLNLLNFLKEHNAMLNTIRPQYLLGYKDFLAYYKNLNSINLHPSFFKITEKNFTRISLANWTLLFTQVLKTFFISRISLKTYKSSFSVLNDKPSSINPDYPIEKNTIYSQQELLMLKWLEVLQKHITGDSVRYLRFDGPFNNCIAIGCALESYIQLDIRLVAKLKGKPVTEDDFLYNFDRTKRFLVDYGVKDELNEKEFLNPNPINFYLLIVHLFKTLPNFSPRSTIEFNCTLHECLIKEIAFSNPANKTIIYTVRLFGHPNFKIENDTLKIEPRQNASFPVQYYANTSLPADGKIIFQNRRNGNSVAGAIVFDLKANVVSRFSMKTTTISDVNLYEMGTCEVIISNPFDKDVDFKMTVDNIPYVEPSKIKKTGKVKKDTRSKLFIPSFFLKQDRIWIKKASTAKVYINYLPITFDTHKCNLLFLDPKIGEMQYEVIGIPRLPVSLNSFKFTSSIDDLTTLELNIVPKNNMLYSACTKLLDKFKDTKFSEYVTIINNLMQNNGSTFEVSVSPLNFFIFSPTFNLFTTKKDAKGAQIVSNPLVLTPTNKQPVRDLQFKILLKDVNSTDIRLYDLMLTILPKTMHASIEMKTTARVPVVQEIPVSNPIAFDCTIKPTFTPMINGHLFDIQNGPFIVKQKSIGTYTIKFHSEWVANAEATLNLYNQLTNDNFEYHIKAEAEEPLSEDNIKIVTKAKTPYSLVFKVRNPIQKVDTFKVDCDIPGAVYEKTMTLGCNEEREFHINFTPKNGGRFLNAITFTADNTSYFWYLITMDIESPAAIRTYNISTEVRKPTVCKIEIDNSLSREITYNVVIQGDNLSGDSIFTAYEGCKSIYELIYYPFKIEERACKIGFLNKDEGELWYDVNVASEEAKPIKLNTLKAELGKSKTQIITLKNPLKKRPINVKCSYNPNCNFFVSHREFVIQPKQSFDVVLTYMPRELNRNESELITFTSNDLGDWKYMVFGIGIQPTDFETTIITSSIGKAATKTLNFRNPFNNDINVSLILENDQAFDILMPKSKNVLVNSLGNIQVIVRFVPEVIKNYNTKLIIRLNDNIYWVYPIQGVTEALTLNKEFVLKTKCGQEIESNLMYEIQGLETIDPSETFTYELNIKHKEADNIRRWLKIKSLKDKLNDPNDSLSYLVSFQPFKPLKTVIDMVISKPSGGRWKLRMQLEALEPDYFETINIVSQLNIKKVVQFKLFNNDNKQSSNFVAYFTQDSDTEFAVEPQKGVLEPAIKEGTTIRISYLPIEYGKLKVGTLIIETDTYMWRFLIKGAFQKFLPNLKKKEDTKKF